MRKLTVVLFALAAAAGAQAVPPSLYAGMHWRLVGPFRAGRISAVAGVEGEPGVYYAGNPGGGVFKTTNGGGVWTPVFDIPGAPDSIGAIAVAQSNPNIIYVGTGDLDNVGGSVNQGDGIWRSDDAGRTWRHLSSPEMDDTRHIGALLLDPRNPDLVLAAALGHTFAPNPARGVFRSTDGGRTWKKVLYEGPEIGAINIAWDPTHPQLVFAGLEEHAPHARGAAPAPGAGIYKSTDEGATWTAVTGHGLPARDLGRLGLAVEGDRVYAITGPGLFRSDDAGATWTQATTDRRIRGSSYFSEVYTLPGHPDTVYVCQTSLYRSTDGGHTFIAFKGAPGGDDYHEVWISRTNPQRMILGVDQGPTITLDGGAHWSLDWYAFPNAQFYHITTDHRFPYWIYGTQQDSGSAAMASRSDFGELTFMDWRPSVGAYEFGYIQPDLQDPNFVYATGGGSALNRYNWKTKQIFDISPPAEVGGVRLRWAGSPQAQEPGVLYLGAQMVLATRDRGLTWTAASPDLTGGGRAAVSTLAAGPRGELWAGTSDARVCRRVNGQWTDVGRLPAPAESLEASPHSPGEAYAAVERHTENDFTPYIYRTTDGGEHWTLITTGLPAGDLVRVVRADPKRAGLLYAGTEWGVFVSFNDGGSWQPLQLNLPRSSVRGLRVHGDDLVAATYGRAVWVLDDLSPLRQLAAAVPTAPTLFAPETAMRVQPDVGYDTPFPPEMPTGENPPPGAVVDYYLPAAAHGPVTLGIYDSRGHLVRELTSVAPPPAPAPELDIPNYWIEPPHPLPATAGMHRVVWDLRYTPPPAFRHEYNIAALAHATPADPRGPFVTPGTYELRLTVDGTTLRRPLTVTMDPRIATPIEGLAAQRDLCLKIAAAMRDSYAAGDQRRNAQLGSLLTLIELSDDAPTVTMQERFASIQSTSRGH